MDLHSPQIQGFFSVPVDNLVAAPVLAKYVENLNLDDLTIVSPDAGGVGRAKWFAKRINADLAIIDKRRPAPNIARVYNVIGKVKNRNVVILDDMVDTGGTLVESVNAIKENGAKKIYSACTHGVLSGQAKDRIKASQLEELIITDTIPVNDKSLQKIVILSVAELFGEAIRRINQGSSVSTLFE